MTPTFRPPPTSKVLARRTGILLLVTATLGLFFGGVCLLLGVLLPRFADSPDLKQMLDDMRAQSPVEPATLFLTGGAIVLAYAVAGLTIGIGLFRATRPWVIAAVVFCSVAGGLMTLNALANLVEGNFGGALGALVLAAPHALGLWWLLHAQTAPQTPVVFVPPPPYRPMQEYYLPPSPPPALREMR